MCSAGEASGDALLASVAAELVARGHTLTGLAGSESAAAGVDVRIDNRQVAAHGLLAAAGTVPALVRTHATLIAAARTADAMLLVDFPELNRRLLSRAAVPVAWLAPPQAWAWRPWRARAVRAARWVGCLLPFEARWYRRRGVAAEWIGHPLAERLAPPLPAAPALALFPGSRPPTVRRLLPILLEAAARLPEVPVAVACAPTVPPDLLSACIEVGPRPDAAILGAAAALEAATVVIAGAGTATLEAALAGRGVVVAARLDPLAEAAARALVRVPHAGLPNLVLGRRAFPEHLLDECTAEGLADSARRLLAAPSSWSADVQALRERVARPGFAARVADRVESMLVRRGASC